MEIPYSNLKIQPLPKPSSILCCVWVDTTYYGVTEDSPSSERDTMHGCIPQESPTGRHSGGKEPGQGSGHTDGSRSFTLPAWAHTPLTEHTQPEQYIFSAATRECIHLVISQGNLLRVLQRLSPPHPITVGPSCPSLRRPRSLASVAVAPNAPPGSEAG